MLPTTWEGEPVDALTRYIFDPDVPASRRMRDIENHYHLEMTARGIGQIAQVQAASLALQAEAAWQQHRDMAEMAFALGELQDGLLDLSNATWELGRTAQRIEASLDSWLATIAEGIAHQQETMEEIATTLRRPLETTVRELRKHADHAISSGASTSGGRREQWYEDALDLLHEAVKNPVGKQDYVAWFQTGWLLWKKDGALSEAAEAFDRAARLAQPAGDVYYWESLRHLAYVRYLSGDQAGALEAIEEARQADENPRTLFDAARYHACNGKPERAIDLLRRGIGLEPTMVVEMMSEADFADMVERLETFVRELVGEQRQRVRSALAGWQQTLDGLRRAEEAAGCRFVSEPARSQSRRDEIASVVDGAHYLECLALEEEALAERGRLRDRATGEHGRLLKREQEAAVALAAAMQHAQRDAEARCQNLKPREIFDPQGAGWCGWGCLLVVWGWLSWALALAVAGLLGDGATFVAWVFFLAIGPVLIYALPRVERDVERKRIQDSLQSQLTQLGAELAVVKAQVERLEQAGRHLRAE